MSIQTSQAFGIMNTTLFSLRLNREKKKDTGQCCYKIQLPLKPVEVNYTRISVALLKDHFVPQNHSVWQYPRDML